MVTLIGFADEIAQELDEQIKVLKEEQIKFLEFRGVWGKGVLELTNDEIKNVKDKLGENKISVSSIGSPIGKIGINDNFEQHLIDFQRAIYVAKYFGTRYIRIFSFFIPNGEDPYLYKEKVIHQMKILVDKAEAEDIILLHENEKNIFGDTPERCLDLFNACRSSHFRCAFDPANFVQCGVKPYSEAYAILEKEIEYVHIKDALFLDGSVVPPGEGDGEVLEVIESLKKKNYRGFLSLEPHLAAAGTFSGFSGGKLFKVATQSLKGLLEQSKVEWN